MGSFTGFAANSGTFTPHPAGNYAGRVFRLVAVGHLLNTYQGESKWQNTLIISVETSELMDDGRPMTINKFLTLSMHERSNLRHWLEAWRGRPFSAEEIRDFDLSSVIGKPGLWNVVAREDGRTALNSVGPLPKGMECPELVNPPVVFDVLEWDNETFETLPEFVQAKIRESREYQDSLGQPVAAAPPPVYGVPQAPPAPVTRAPAPPAPEAAVVGDPEFDDDIPF